MAIDVHIISFRFSLNLDIAAPKITVPTKFRPDDIHETKLLLDLGHLILRTEVLFTL
jgi:vacuolar protein sorting-associated protein 13A/C